MVEAKRNHQNEATGYQMITLDRLENGPLPGESPKVSMRSEKSVVVNVVAVPPQPAAGVVPLRAWGVLFVSCIGILLASISTTALVIAFPVLLEDLDMTIVTMMWILLITLLMIAGTVVIAGKLGDIFGQAGLYKFGYTMFVIGNLIGGLSKATYQGKDMLGSRVIVGFGCGFLFTNTSAILTNAFAPYGKVGLAQGIFQLSLALGIVLGPVVGGSMADTDWRWIFFYNVPIAGVATIVSFLVVHDDVKVPPPVITSTGSDGKPAATTAPPAYTWQDRVRRFDWIGFIFYPSSLALILTAMIQAVVPSQGLNKPRGLSGLIVGGVLSAIIFIVDQFYAIDPLIPPHILLKNKIFFVTMVGGTSIAFVRYSITYNMIFYLQGAKGQTPLEAGITLIPFGIGIMVAGFSAGMLADKVGIRAMTMIGPMICLAGVAVMTQWDTHSSTAQIGGILFFSGLGVGLFNSPNTMSNMLSVKREERGVAAAVGMMTLMFCAMLGIVLTFALVLDALTSEQLFDLFIYGGSSFDTHTMNAFLNAIAIDNYIVLGICCLATFCASFNDFVPPKLPGQQPPLQAVSQAGPVTTEEGDGDNVERMVDHAETNSDSGSVNQHQHHTVDEVIHEVVEEIERDTELALSKYTPYPITMIGTAGDNAKENDEQAVAAGQSPHYHQLYQSLAVRDVEDGGVGEGRKQDNQS